MRMKISLFFIDYYTSNGHLMQNQHMGFFRWYGSPCIGAAA